MKMTVVGTSRLALQETKHYEHNRKKISMDKLRGLVQAFFKISRCR